MVGRYIHTLRGELMKKPIVIEHNVATGEIIEREMTDAELQQSLENDKLTNDYFVAIEQKEAEKAALLQRLGITADEAKLLLS